MGVESVVSTLPFVRKITSAFRGLRLMGAYPMTSEYKANLR